MKQNMKVVFIVPTNMLAHQQGKMCKKFLPKWKTHYTGGGIQQARLQIENEEIEPFALILKR